jgi:hypothetical protein
MTGVLPSCATVPDLSLTVLVVTIATAERCTGEMVAAQRSSGSSDRSHRAQGAGRPQAVQA